MDKKDINKTVGKKDINKVLKEVFNKLEIQVISK